MNCSPGEHTLLILKGTFFNLCSSDGEKWLQNTYADHNYWRRRRIDSSFNKATFAQLSEFRRTSVFHHASFYIPVKSHLPSCFYPSVNINRSAGGHLFLHCRPCCNAIKVYLWEGCRRMHHILIC